MMGPNGPRPPIEGRVKDIIREERTLKLVPSASRQEEMLQENISQLDDQLIVTKTDAESILTTMQGLEPNAKNAIYINALQVLIKAINDAVEARRKL